MISKPLSTRVPLREFTIFLKPIFPIFPGKPLLSWLVIYVLLNLWQFTTIDPWVILSANYHGMFFLSPISSSSSSSFFRFYVFLFSFLLSLVHSFLNSNLMALYSWFLVIDSCERIFEQRIFEVELSTRVYLGLNKTFRVFDFLYIGHAYSISEIFFVWNSAFYISKHILHVKRELWNLLFTLLAELSFYIYVLIMFLVLRGKKKKKKKKRWWYDQFGSWLAL